MMKTKFETDVEFLEGILKDFGADVPRKLSEIPLALQARIELRIAQLNATQKGLPTMATLEEYETANRKLKDRLRYT